MLLITKIQMSWVLTDLICCFLFTFGAGVRYGTHDLLYLVNGGSPREQCFSQQHLSQDTAKAPHVHTFSVPLDETCLINSGPHTVNIIAFVESSTRLC